MTNQQEERPLSIGSAVQFTHKGKTIHGHLLQRQGRRRLAKVIDTGERTWKVSESALKHLGGARLASSHPETHHLSFLSGCFLYQMLRFQGSVLADSRDGAVE